MHKLKLKSFPVQNMKTMLKLSAKNKTRLLHTNIYFNLFFSARAKSLDFKMKILSRLFIAIWQKKNRMAPNSKAKR